MPPTPHLDEVLRQALVLDPHKRQRFLETQCAGDTALKQAVEQRLALMDKLHQDETVVTRGGKSSPVEREVPPLPQIPNYEIQSVLGQGGMGVVYRAVHIPLHRAVAIKMLSTAGPPTDEQIVRFRKEAGALARMHHPNVIEIYDFGECEGRPYFVMEAVEGLSLVEYAEGTPQPPIFAARIIEVLARAMHAVHQQGLVHRDLKPANILLHFVSKEDFHNTMDPTTGIPSETRVLVPKITDFGVAKDLLTNEAMTKTGMAVGTPQYMAPEQAEAERTALGPPTDVYALGALLYELLTGQPPIRGTTPYETLKQIAIYDPVPPSRLQPGVPRDLDVICAKCLEKLPTRRYASALALAEDLECFLNGQPIKARPMLPLMRLVRWCRRRPAVATFAGLSLLLTILLVGSILVYNNSLQIALKESRQSLLRLYITSGIDEADTGLAFNGMLWFVEALKVDKGVPDAELRDRIRIGTGLRRGPTLVGLLGDPDHAIETCTVSADGLAVAVADQGGTVRVWSIDPADPSAPVKGRGLPIRPGAPVRLLTISPDRQVLATIGANKAVGIWKIETGEALKSPEHTDVTFDHVVFEPQGKLLLLREASHRSIRAWNPALGRWQPIPALPKEPLEYAGFSEDGGLLITVNSGMEARIIPTGQTDGTAKPLRLGHKVTDAALSLDGRHLAFVDDKGLGYICDTTSSGPEIIPLAYPGKVVKLAFSRKGEYLATANNDYSLRLWDTKTRQQRFSAMMHLSDILSMSFSSDGNYFTSGSDDNRARVWSMATGQPVTFPLQHTADVFFAGFGSRGEFVITGDSAAVRVWQMPRPVAATGPAPVLTAPQADMKEAFSPDRRFRVVLDGATARLFLEGSETPYGKPLEHASPIVYAAFSPDSKLVVTTSDDNTARVWNSLTGDPVLPPLLHLGTVLSAAFSPDGTQLVTTSKDLTARIWSVITGEPLSASWQHRRPVVDGEFSSDGRKVYTLDSAGQVYTWDITPELRSVETVELVIRLLESARVTSDRGVKPMDRADLWKTWKALQERLTQEKSK